MKLTTGLPVDLSITSGINAIEHPVQALCSTAANLITDDFAIESINGWLGHCRGSSTSPPT